MCILFFCQSEICQPDGYRLILANNRDEAWCRPTKEADFWGQQEECISGLDQEPGRVGGTWLGMNRSGKIGALLNILGCMDPSKIGRGHLVTDYISGESDIHEYAQKIFENKDKYNGFSLVLFDLGKQEDSLTVKPVFVSNACSYLSCVNMRSLPANTFVGVSNSPLEYPFQKALKGKDLFGQIVTQYPTIAGREHLIEKLMSLMADRTSLLPDPVLEKAGLSAGYNPSRVSQQSAINVWSPETKYGSRTTTLVLVDSQGSVDYIERTVDPIDSIKPQETVVRKIFKLTG
uniref:Transport and Golgi organization protein 2 homolog n=1 Tax=Arion vulgaris TaxID=1028688 RepID=A0A0B7AB84_9EUPU